MDTVTMGWTDPEGPKSGWAVGHEELFGVVPEYVQN